MTARRGKSRSRRTTVRMARYCVLHGGLNTRIARTDDPSGLSLAEAKAFASANLDHVFSPDQRGDYKDWVYEEVLPQLRREIESLEPGDIDEWVDSPTVDWVWPLSDWTMPWQSILDRLPEDYLAKYREERRRVGRPLPMAQ